MVTNLPATSLPKLIQGGMGIAISMLMFTGATLWDRQLEARVHHGPMTPPRILVAIGGFFLLMIISSLKFS